jgi:hypothetical protein
MKHQNEAPEPSVSLSMEETSLVVDGLECLPIDRKKTVVFDRLVMKLGKVENYWTKIEKARQARRDQVANQLLDQKE